ncbi:MAG: flagellar motor switch protein FliG [Solirubrobacteraceae bacterium]|nr:flagellar motor switch protein FliG [Solirubrobacteraceae bacterium]
MTQPLSVVAMPSPAMGAALATSEAQLPAAPGGPSKAAIALVALGAEHAAEVLRHLPEAQAEALSAEIAKMGIVDQALLDSVCDDLIAETGPADAPQGGIVYTRDVLERVVGAERADELIAQFMGGERKPFDFMRSMAAEEIIDLLEGEAAQTIALVVVNLRASLAGGVLDGMEARLQADVAHRLATLTPVEPRVLRDIDTGLREKAAGTRTEKGEAPPSGVDILAQILQGAGRATERQVLGGLESVDPELAEAVRAKMFTFEDLPKLSDKDLQLVLRDIDAKDLTMALRGVTDELMERVISNMSQRAGETLREEMQMQAPVKRAVVEEAQTVVVAAIRALEEAGSIELPGGEEEAGSAGEPEVLL